MPNALDNLPVTLVTQDEPLRMSATCKCDPGSLIWQDRLVSNPYFVGLECGHCATRHSHREPQTLCRECGGPLLARYDLSHPALPSLEDLKRRSPGQFRFHEVLPTDSGADTPTLGEGATPLLRAPGLGPEIWIKDEAQNPTGSFKARGMAVALARAVDLGLKHFALPSNGNGGGAAAAYGALHGVNVQVVVPLATPQTLIDEPHALGAKVETVDGTIAMPEGSLHHCANQVRSSTWPLSGSHSGSRARR